MANVTIAHVALGAGVTACFYPVAYSKVLIQLGYEPIAPVVSTSLFGSKVLMYPNVLEYTNHIRRTDGFLGMYRGLGARILCGIVNNFVTSSVQQALAGEPLDKDVKNASEIDGDNDIAGDFQKLCISTSYETISRCAGVVVSHPLHVIVVRSMAQFVGRETKYNGLFSSISEIWHNEGVLGFFSGLVPRLLGEVITIWLCNVLAHLINTFCLPPIRPGTQNMRKYTGAFCQLMVTQLTYPFNLVSNVMTVNNCGLAAGKPPIVPVYNGWIDCWRNLSNQAQLKRGASIFWRLYSGPVTFLPDGTMTAVVKSL